jgi:hypothetical protein
MDSVTVLVPVVTAFGELPVTTPERQDPTRLVLVVEQIRVFVAEEV